MVKEGLKRLNDPDDALLYLQCQTMPRLARGDRTHLPAKIRVSQRTCGLRANNPNRCPRPCAITEARCPLWGRFVPPFLKNRFAFNDPFFTNGVIRHDTRRIGPVSTQNCAAATGTHCLRFARNLDN